MNKEELKRAVKKILESNIPEDKEDVKLWLDDLENHGCISGGVNGLIYYYDTVAFFDDFEESILDLAREYDYKLDVVTLGVQQVKNNLAWFTFEIMARQVYDESDYKGVE